MIKIGVISDTHIPMRARVLPDFVFESFKGVDLILHAGDLLSEDIITDLEIIAPVYAVAGNNDSFRIYEKYGERRIVEVGNKRIGLTHGYGRDKTHLNAYREFMNDKVDCVVFGHSHIPFNEIIDGVLLFNPGSPTDRRFQPRFSLGLLYVYASIKGEILYFDPMK
ncbi:metallophosphoesterase family protein [Lutispora thermophila]|uniref:Phosphoesterase n=1 Tax=Lutispora thermophila DSM 19022 TaxID=1122184 RepID=A0A1M6DTV1_9FIRM|nr:hypothetical protein SAMN02745176_01286 [Lutispora thermophila DSM 19022]